MTAPVSKNGAYDIYQGTGVNDGDTLFETEELSTFDGFMLQSTVGSVKVRALLRVSGTYTTVDMGLQDLCSVATDPVLSTTAGKVYGVVGNFHSLKILQNGATAATALLRAWKKSNG